MPKPTLCSSTSSADAPLQRLHGSDLYQDLDPGQVAQLDAIGTVLELAPHEYLMHQHSPAKYVYNPISGNLLIERISATGRRQVLAFLFPGDFLGFTHTDYFEVSVQALTATRLYAYNRKEFLHLSDSWPTLKHNMDRISSHVLSRVMDQVYALGQKKAHERVCFLLCQLLERQPGANPRDLLLPMTRQDIADYLGLTIETVSRAFAKLKQDGIIKIYQVNHVEVCDETALAELASAD